MEKQINKLKKYIIFLATMVLIMAVINAVLIIKLATIRKEKKQDAEDIKNEAVNSEDIGGVTGEPEGKNDPDVTVQSSENGENSQAADNSTEELSTDENSSGTTESTEQLSDIDQKVEETIAQMSLRDKVCQMFLVTPESLTGYSLCTSAGDATKEALNNYPVAGVIYFGANLEDRSQTEEMISNTKQYAEELNGLPFFIAVDEEGGDVARCADNLGTTVFDNMYSYRDEGTDKAYSNAYTIASDIRSIGFNLDFAPVADTWSNSANTVIGRRAYSDDFAETAELVAAAVKGFNDGGVICTLKHFPGHGDTSEDSHSGSAYATKSLAELQKEEFLAFKSGIDAGADMVMVGHITMTGVDGQPAVFSHTMVTEQLREKLGFEGVIITDALNMGAISNIYSSDEAAIKCIEAGIDLLLMPNDLETAVNGVLAAVENGTITEERINESVRRILKLKFEKLD